METTTCLQQTSTETRCFFTNKSFGRKVKADTHALTHTHTETANGSIFAVHTVPAIFKHILTTQTIHISILAQSLKTLWPAVWVLNERLINTF